MMRTRTATSCASGNGSWRSSSAAHVEPLASTRGCHINAPPSGAIKAPRPGWDGGAYAFMRSVLGTEHGGTLYRQRQHMVEPVFADKRFNRRLDRFLRRGRAAARTEWRLITATHNPLKLWRHTTAPQFA
jgi:hypothetical protein